MNVDDFVNAVAPFVRNENRAYRELVAVNLMQLLDEFPAVDLSEVTELIALKSAQAEYAGEPVDMPPVGLPTEYDDGGDAA